MLALESQVRGLAVTRLAPFGCVLDAPRPASDFRSLPLPWLRELVAEHRVVVARGFALFDEAPLVAYCRSWGPLLEWNFGVIFQLHEHEDPKNYLFTNSRVPLHWDGAFAAAVPSFQLFQCLDAPPIEAGGETTFSDTVRVWDDASPEERALWSRISITYGTEKVAHYGGRITSPLVGKHPWLGRPTLRYAEPFDAETVRLNELSLEVHGLGREPEEAFFHALHRALYDPRHLYAHRWRAGDILIADNHALLHGRNGFHSRAPRRLQRVHIL